MHPHDFGAHWCHCHAGDDRCKLDWFGSRGDNLGHSTGPPSSTAAPPILHLRPPRHEALQYDLHLRRNQMQLPLPAAHTMLSTRIEQQAWLIPCSWRRDKLVLLHGVRKFCRLL